MDCEQLIVWLDSYLDGGLPQWRMTAMSAHLDDCPPCAKGYRLELHFRSIVAQKCIEEAPYNLRLRIEEALACAPPPEPGGGPRLGEVGDLGADR